MGEKTGGDIMKKKTANFLISVLRLMLQIIGTYYVGKFILAKIASIPAETWGWMALIVLLSILLIGVWLFTLVETFKGEKKPPKQ